MPGAGDDMTTVDGRTTEAKLADAVRQLAHHREALELVMADPTRHGLMKFRLCEGRVIAAVAHVEELRVALLLRDGHLRRAS